MKANSLGIDSINLGLIDYRITDDTHLQVQPVTWSPSESEIEVKGWELWRCSGGEVRGAKAFYNDEVRNFNVSLKPSAYGHNATNLTVQMSVPKHLTGDNYQPADVHTTAESLASLGRALDEIGIKTNLDNAEIVRLDMTRNLHTSERFEDYEPLLSTLKGRRTKQTKYVNEGFLWGNRQQQVTAYDKLKEMVSRKRDVKDLPRTLRLEHRLLKGRKVRDATGFRTSRDLLEGFDSLPSVYEKAVRNQLFRDSAPETPQISTEDFINGMRHFKESGSRYWLRDYLMAMGLSSVIGSGDMDRLRDSVIEVAGGRQNASRLLVTLESAKRDALTVKSLSRNRTHADLLRELETLAFQP
jgi:hypothetical protein